MIDTIKLPRTRVSPSPNRLSTCLNSKFLLNYISTPFCKGSSLKYELATSRAFLIHGLAHRSLSLFIFYNPALDDYGTCEQHVGL